MNRCPINFKYLHVCAQYVNKTYHTIPHHTIPHHTTPHHRRVNMHMCTDTFLSVSLCSLCHQTFTAVKLQEQKELVDPYLQFSFAGRKVCCNSLSSCLIQWRLSQYSREYSWEQLHYLDVSWCNSSCGCFGGWELVVGGWWLVVGFFLWFIGWLVVWINQLNCLLTGQDQSPLQQWSPRV